MTFLFKWLIYTFPIAVIISLVETSYREVKRIKEAKKVYLHGDTVMGFWFGWSVGCPRRHGRRCSRN